MLETIGNCLIVDDRQTIRRQVGSWLGGKGFACSEARDGPRGWELIESGRIDLLITEIDLPGFSGLDLIRMLRKSEKKEIRRLSTLVISSRVNSTTETTVKQCGGDGLVGKPLEKSTFLDAVFRTLRGSALWCASSSSSHTPVGEILPTADRFQFTAARMPRSTERARLSRPFFSAQRRKL